MDNKYKVILQNRRICREIELDENRSEITIGTDIDCNVRFNRESFLYDFDFSLRNIKGAWQVRCGESTYITDSNAMKYASKGLNHGDTYSIKEKKSGTEIFKLTFTLDFESREYRYNTFIDLSNRNSLTFGNSDSNDVVLRDTLLDGRVAVMTAE
ncbi:MAG: hypothetical protein IKN56_05340, partial [Clostridia bacterium]|nr:hypothetical protein [Clostridia bacterium]